MDICKLAVLGGHGVGKTTLTVQFIANCFVETEGYGPIFEETHRKQLVVDDQMCLVEVIDTVTNISQEEYTTLRYQWWVSECQGFVLVYSVTSRSTFDQLEVFHQSLQREKGGNPIFMLVGNKCDRTAEREVSKEEGAALAQQFGCEFFEISAKTAENVEQSFTNLIRVLRQTKNIKSVPPMSPARPKKNFRGKCIIL
ncbi:ras protein [Marasmius fiardii PR-910]|nr:ras protein [Marasmius fiardii PR-910]